MIILGIDPGTARTGFSIIKKTRDAKQKFKALDYGCIQTCPTLSAGERLKKINSEINKLIKKFNPKIIAVERVYFFKNLKTVMPVSQAKGVILFTAAKKRIPVYEITPLQMKMAITGYGRAEKKQVQEAIQKILKLKEFPKDDDAADAMGVALCCFLQNSELRRQKS